MPGPMASPQLRPSRWEATARPSSPRGCACTPRCAGTARRCSSRRGSPSTQRSGRRRRRWSRPPAAPRAPRRRTGRPRSTSQRSRAPPPPGPHPPSRAHWRPPCCRARTSSRPERAGADSGCRCAARSTRRSCRPAPQDPHWSRASAEHRSQRRPAETSAWIWRRCRSPQRACGRETRRVMGPPSHGLQGCTLELGALERTCCETGASARAPPAPGRGPARRRAGRL